MKSAKLLTLTALFAALVCVVTAYVGHIPVGTLGGYVHFGDACIFLAASFLPMPYAMAAASVGAGLADLLSGAPHWIIPTVIIKSIMVTALTSKKETVLCARNAIGAVIASVIGIVGYYIAESLMLGNWIVPLAGIPMGGAVQAVGGLVMYAVIGIVMDKTRVKSRLKRL